MIQEGAEVAQDGAEPAENWQRESIMARWFNLAPMKRVDGKYSRHAFTSFELRFLLTIMYTLHLVIRVYKHTLYVEYV